MNGDPQECPVCGQTPTVLVAIAHPAGRRLTVELLEREHGCWHVQALAVRSDLARALTIAPPDLVVVDAADFPRCCRDALDSFPPDRVIVVGPEPDPAYEWAARRAGAGAWLARDRVAEDLSTGMRAALGCTHARCPDEHDDNLNERRPVAVDGVMLERLRLRSAGDVAAEPHAAAASGTARANTYGGDNSVVP